jgi:hypothetical protein
MLRAINRPLDLLCLKLGMGEQLRIHARRQETPSPTLPARGRETRDETPSPTLPTREIPRPSQQWLLAKGRETRDKWGGQWEARGRESQA